MQHPFEFGLSDPAASRSSARQAWLDDEPIYTTLALGEEGGDGDVTTLAIGEEGGDFCPPVDYFEATTKAIGEEGGWATTFALGEEGGDWSTDAIGEEGGWATTRFIGENGEVTTLALGEEGGDWPLVGTKDDDVVYGCANNDLILGRAGHDTLNGQGGDDTVFGGQGDDTLFGEEGDDKLKGGDGEDCLWGGDGINRLHGGEGADLFGVALGSGWDIIRDFEDGQDQILLPAGLFPDQIEVVEKPNGILLKFEGDRLAKLCGVEASSIDQRDYLVDLVLDITPIDFPGSWLGP
jgi:Ca2+-binding RTX toxin-like protein